MENAKSNKEKSDLKTQIKLEKDNMGRAGAGTLASTLGAVGAGFTASGVGAPVGAAHANQTQVATHARTHARTHALVGLHSPRA